MNTFSGLNTTGNHWNSPVATNDYKEEISYDPNGNILTYLRNGSSATNLLMDNMTYHYNSGNNQLNHVTDLVASGNYSVDIDNQSSNNYLYDAIGNLIKDNAEGISSITWNVYGKISSITKTSGTISYTYDATGNRISKTVGGVTTLYVRDASGNVMSVYEIPSINNIIQKELHIYGSSRLGMVTGELEIEEVSLPSEFGEGKIVSVTRGKKYFELSNHLGNVLAVVSDKRIPVAGGVYEADIVTATDYAPFGMGLVGREYNFGDAYRYSINGQEKTPEIAPNTTTAEYWQYDARLGRRWNVDPVIKSYESSYLSFANNPLIYVDPNGLDTIPVHRSSFTQLRKELDNNNISGWIDLLKFDPNNKLIKDMNSRRGLKRATLQKISSSRGNKTNIDFYSMEINLPEGWDAQTLLEEIRLNFSLFMSSNTKFRSFNKNEKSIWNSENPLGAVMAFDEYFEPTGILGDDASVLTSYYYSGVNGAFWNFSTLYTPWSDWGHPVSGTRQFGVSANGENNFTFFIRGIDRISDGITQIHGILSEEFIFDQAHKTWIDVMNNIRSFLENKGAKVTINPIISERKNWNGKEGIYSEYLKHR